ncbi:MULTISPECIES: glycoside hydrolase family 32 protein [Acidobacteriaceae]|uniref:glycoside hydrolase family 32 protein n=1 Tax=Acidobacteriaceae TaxID=204434 RepID=UPI00131B4DA7|nr:MULTISPECIES: glycoside hydrolase family 32 protein [Acidobacteriaceae]MDW5266017.1 glycoside hydrolase family 32 protein [Edaphobacter sp.]
MKKKSVLVTRRELLSSAALMAAASMVPRGILAQEIGKEDAGLEAKLAEDPMRPQFHLLPASNWMNDPNGPIYFNGSYHMFCQYNPHAAVWGDMSWYHSISQDMIHWTHLPIAFIPTSSGQDAYGCFSGSAIAVGNRVYVVYTGTVLSTLDKATIRDGENKIQESQCLAWSDDSRLIHWTKEPKAIVPLAPPGMQITGFRDPSAWKQGDWYYMTVGSGVAKVGGCVLLYRSKDMKSWEYMHQIATGVWTGKHTANPCDDGEMWECPELFALDGAHVLIYSTEGKVFWQSGKLDSETMLFHPAKTGQLDLGAFYAPKSQLDANGQRVLWGWIPERRPEAEHKAAGWAGMMSLPRVLHLDQDGTLQMEILPALVTLRSASPVRPANSSNKIEFTLQKASGEVLCTALRRTEAFEFIMQNSIDNGELLHVAYDPVKHAFLVENKEIALEPNDTPQLHTYVDGSVIEVILSQRAGYTRRFYYTQTSAPDITVRVIGGTRITASAWTIDPISNNRLTTPSAIA